MRKASIGLMAAIAAAGFGMAASAGEPLVVDDTPKPPRRSRANRITNPGNGAGSERRRYREAQLAADNAQYYRNVTDNSDRAENRQAKRTARRKDAQLVAKQGGKLKHIGGGSFRVVDDQRPVQFSKPRLTQRERGLR